MGPIWKAIHHPQPLSVSLSLSLSVYMSLSRPQISSFQSTVFFWRPQCMSWHSQTTDQILPLPLLFSDVSLMLRHIEIRPQRNELLLTSCCAPNSYHCQEKTDVDGDGKRQRSRQELWERAQFDMRISFCKHTDQSVSGYWHPRVLHSHIFRDTEFESTAQGL